MVQRSTVRTFIDQVEMHVVINRSRRVERIYSERGGHGGRLYDPLTIGKL